MPEKLDKCVHQVKDKDGVYNPYAVCNASLSESCEKEFPFMTYFIHRTEAVSGSSMPQLMRPDVQEVKLK